MGLLATHFSPNFFSFARTPSIVKGNKSLNLVWFKWGSQWWGILKHFPQSRCIFIPHWTRESSRVLCNMDGSTPEQYFFLGLIGINLYFRVFFDVDQSQTRWERGRKEEEEVLVSTRHRAASRRFLVLTLFGFLFTPEYRRYWKIMIFSRRKRRIIRPKTHFFLSLRAPDSLPPYSVVKTNA